MDANRIVGVWRLVAQVYEDVETKERVPVFGDHPTGCQIATPDGRWIAVATAEGRSVPQTDAERSAALRSMIAYTGRYRVEDGRIVTKVEAAWNESWVGSEQVRYYRFEGENRMHLQSDPQPHPNLLGRKVRIIVTWEREESLTA
jgi:Lipocalin-like domain